MIAGPPIIRTRRTIRLRDERETASDVSAVMGLSAFMALSCVPLVAIDTKLG